MLNTTLPVVLVMLALCTGCATHYVQYSANTEPDANWVYREGASRSCEDYYRQRITSADRKAGQVDLPPLVFEARGHLPKTFYPGPFKLDKDFWNNASRIGGSGGGIVHGYHNSREITLKPDPQYEGPEKKNEVELIINSEPPGCKIYQAGKYRGTTPYTSTYIIDNKHYRQGHISCIPYIAVKDGYLAHEIETKIEIPDEWKYASRKTFESRYGLLFILRRDPNDRRPVVGQQGTPQQAPTHQTIEVKQDPHHGREWQTGLRALGEAIRPHSKLSPAETEKHIRALEGSGVLIDLMNK